MQYIDACIQNLAGIPNQICMKMRYRQKARLFVRVLGIGPRASVLSGQRSTTELYTRGDLLYQI